MDRTNRPPYGRQNLRRTMPLRGGTAASKVEIDCQEQRTCHAQPRRPQGQPPHQQQHVPCDHRRAPQPGLPALVLPALLPALALPGIYGGPQAGDPDAEQPCARGQPAGRPPGTGRRQDHPASTTPHRRPGASSAGGHPCRLPTLPGSRPMNRRSAVAAAARTSAETSLDLLRLRAADRAASAPHGACGADLGLCVRSGGDVAAVEEECPCGGKERRDGQQGQRAAQLDAVAQR